MVLAGEEQECILQGEMRILLILLSTMSGKMPLPTSPEVRNVLVGFRLRPGFKCQSLSFLLILMLQRKLLFGPDLDVLSSQH